jgi:uncharacterized protein with FMN-binding domain
MDQGKKYSGGLMVLAIGALLIATMLPGCAQTPVNGAPINHARLEDGAYEGSYRGGPNKASVRVTIENGNIVKIEILQHQAWRGHIAEAAIVERIIDHQSTKVDAVSGATNSSRVIMNAVQNAVEKAYKN